VTYLELIILAVALAIDAVSVAASAGPRVCPRWGALRLGLCFGGFQALMPLLGALAGAYLYTYVRAYDHWVAFGLLLLIGLKMLYEAARRHGVGEEGAAAGFDPSVGWSLLGLSIATSIDAFGAGMGLRMAEANLWVAAPLIGAVTAALSYSGAHLGVRAERFLGRKAEFAGGVVLVGLAVRMLRI
jgi:putative Mn2+ efflux pump MntP